VACFKVKFRYLSSRIEGNHENLVYQAKFEKLYIANVNKIVDGIFSHVICRVDQGVL
jgi:hypothetical protein